MDFEKWLNESTIPELYNNTVRAFPTCGLRQHATNPIKIVYLEWIPYVGMKTLYVKGLANNQERTYNSIIVFKGVQYQEEKGRNSVPLIDNAGKKYLIERISMHDQDVLVRCNCGDFYWRGNYFNGIDKSLQGRIRKKYEAKQNTGASNPMKLPMVCKHLIKLAKVLEESGIVI